MTKHTPTDSLTELEGRGDETLVSVCEHCHLPIQLTAFYDDDWGMKYAKDWAHMTYVPARVTPNARVGVFNTECLPELAN